MALLVVGVPGVDQTISACEDGYGRKGLGGVGIVPIFQGTISKSCGDFYGRRKYIELNIDQTDTDTTSTTTGEENKNSK